MVDEKNVLDEQNTAAKPKTGARMKPGGNTDARLTGLFILLVGAGAGYWQIILPIEKALQQEPDISYSSEIAIIASIAVFMGLFLLVFGAEGLGFLSRPSSNKVGLVLFFIGIIVFVLACYFGMQFILRGLGYY
jgi:predicted acyltransferase